MNLFQTIDAVCNEEQFDTLFAADALSIERIVSTGQATPEGEWYDQNWDEWVVIISGSAGLLLGTDPEVKILNKGDSLFLPAHLKHRVEWTSAEHPTLWLAVHFNRKGE